MICPVCFYETAGGVKIKLLLPLLFPLLEGFAFAFVFSLLVNNSPRAPIRTLISLLLRLGDLLVSDADEFGAAI